MMSNMLQTKTITRVSFDREELKKHIGTTLKLARLEKGLTQEDLSVIIGVSRTQLANIELGRSYPGTEALLLAVVHFHLVLDRHYLGVTATESD